MCKVSNGLSLPVLTANRLTALIHSLIYVAITLRVMIPHAEREDYGAHARMKDKERIQRCDLIRCLFDIRAFVYV
jgi:hypothetical protein